jgi:two-component system chemotaxis response regulator CheY
MIDIDDELAERHLAGCREYLAAMETDLLAAGNDDAGLDQERVVRLLLAARSVGGGAEFFELVNLRLLAQHTEDALAKVGSGPTALTGEQAKVLLRAAAKMKELIPDPAASNQADIAAILEDLAAPAAAEVTSGDPRDASAVGRRHTVPGPLRILLVDDDFSSRMLLQSFLSRYGECHIAVNGKEAVEAFRSGLERKQTYDLICMDIMMPEMDGPEAVRQIRAMEEARGILSNNGAKIVMTTAVDDIKSVAKCFQDLCDAYLVKPIDLAKLLAVMRSYQLAT